MPRDLVVVAGRDMAANSEGAIVFRSITGDDVGLWKVDRDVRHPIQLAKGSVNFPMITPDGQQVVFSSPAGGAQSVWRVPTAGGAPLQIVNATVRIYSFSDVSPDGRSIAIVLDGKWTICDFPACTTRKPASIAGFLPRWTPDGRGLSYVDQGTVPGSTSNLWVQPIDGSAARQLTRFTDGRSIGSYAWSRDGRLAISLASFSSDIVLFSGLKGKPVMSRQ